LRQPPTSSRSSRIEERLRRHRPAELTGYHLIEVFNGKFPHDAAWDAALSSGRAVWGIGNDDNHDLEDRERLGAAWTMINAPSGDTPDIVAALKSGRSYAVVRTNQAAAETFFKSATVSD
jgi:hypothetical protein